MKRGPRSPVAGHPAGNVWLDFVEMRLPAGESRRLAGHLHTCPVCRQEVDRWSALLGRLADERQDAPPAWLSAWAARIPGARPTRARAGLLRLVADSWSGLLDRLTGGAPGLAPALRGRAGTERLGRRRLLFSSAGFDLDLELRYPGPDDPRGLRGQILPTEGPRALLYDATVALERAGRELARARLNRRGEFDMPRIPRGRYRLRVRGPSSLRTPFFEV